MEGDTADDSTLGKYESALNIFQAESDKSGGHDEKLKVRRRGFFKDFKPSHDLDKLCRDCMKKYPMVTLMDNHHFNWRFTPKSVEETINYVTMIEATYITKKKIIDSKENIFKCVEKLEKKTLDKQAQLN